MKWGFPECKRPQFLAWQTMRLQESVTEDGKGEGGGPSRCTRERDPKAVEAIALLLLECDVGEGGEGGSGAGVYTVRFKAAVTAPLPERNERLLAAGNARVETRPVSVWL